MNDEQDPALDPEQEERVRALLADLGTAPEAATMPPHVSARLEETLAGLVAERTAPPDEAADPDVVPLRRRRWAPRLAAAAAVVIVAGVGGVAVSNAHLFGGATGQSDSTAGGSSADKAESLDSSAPTAPSPRQPGALSGEVPASLPRVTAATFDSDVARLLKRSPALRESTDQRKSQDSSSGGSRAVICPGPRTSDGSTTTPVQYDGTRAALVVHPAEDGQRLVEAWTCTGSRMLDSAHIPAGLGSANPSP